MQKKNIIETIIKLDVYEPGKGYYNKDGYYNMDGYYVGRYGTVYNDKDSDYYYYEYGGVWYILGDDEGIQIMLEDDDNGKFL